MKSSSIPNYNELKRPSTKLITKEKTEEKSTNTNTTNFTELFNCQPPTDINFQNKYNNNLENLCVEDE